jgi:hypothetical protein
MPSTNCLIHPAEPFLRGRQLRSYSNLPSILWYPNVHYYTSKSHPLVAILCHKQIHTTPSYLSKYILILSIQAYLGLPSGRSPSSFTTNNLCTFLFSHIHAMCPDYLILLDMHIPSIVEKRSCSLCSVLQAPLSSPVLVPDILLSTLLSNTLSLSTVKI